MKNRVACIVSCGVCLALLGCAGEQRRFSGFLRDYSKLGPHPTIPGAYVYLNPNIDPSEYRSVLIEPIEVQFVKHSDASRAKPEDMAAFRRFVADELTAAISQHTAVVTEPGPHVLRCRLQVSNLQLTRPMNEPPYRVLPADYVLGSASIEFDAHDSTSGELVAAYVSPKGSAEVITPALLSSPPGRWEPAKAAIRNGVVTIDNLYSDRVAHRGNSDVAYHDK